MIKENFKSFSAKDLCSRSCMQIKMFDLHPELRPVPNVNVNNGVNYQHQIASTMEDLIGEEMRGTFAKDGILINFSNDIVCKDKIYEIKSVTREAEDWYFKSSILQCAVYKSLLLKSNKKLVTSKFFVELGNPYIETNVNENVSYYLKFGDDLYIINVNNPDKIVEFVYNKANASLDWDKAREFDFNYKRKEYETLEDCFSFEKVDMA